MADTPPTPAEQVRRLYEEAESNAAKAAEQVVGRDAFGELLGKVAENVLGVVKLSQDATDMVVRNLRVAGRRDVIDLGRQLARTEDKLEQVLQEVERLQEELARRDAPEAPPANGGTRSRGSSRGAGSRRSGSSSSANGS
jgi:hypothetical protein